MFCSKCGTQVQEGAAFCANCGNSLAAAPVAEPVAEVATPVVEAPVEVAAPAVEAPVEVATPVAAPVYQEPTYQAPTYQEPTYQQAPTYNTAPVQPVDAKSLMIKGILAIALCEIGIPGIILGSMAKKLAAQFMAQNNGQIFGKAKVGSILGRIGFGFGIGFTIFWAFYFIIIVGILGAL
ncbi:MAG: zinc ribbon domain-containing protein [Ruminococcus sp.]|nr:zinc ribbon domain-containing protein [Ruminococcus sp.]